MYNSIRPGKEWRDTNGSLIQAHGFSVFYKDGTYYWYGENKEKTDGKGTVWHWGIRCYTSKDLYNWEDRGLLIPPEPDDLMSPLHPTYCMDRPHILFCEKTGKYVCWIKVMAGTIRQFMVVLQADSFLGPYTYVHKVYKVLSMDTGDFTLAKDDATGKAYLIFDRPHFELITATLSEDYTEVTGEYSTHYENRKPPYTREAPVYFEHDGKKYLFTSGTTGYFPNPTDTAVITDFHKPYQSLGSPHIDDFTRTSFSSQITCVLKVPGRKLWIAMADRWMPNPLMPYLSPFMQMNLKMQFRRYSPETQPLPADIIPGKEQRHRENTSISRYVWLPIEWEGDIPHIRWLKEWRIEDYPEE